PLVGIRRGGVAAQFRAGDDWCARGESPDRRLRLDGGRRGISAWSGRAPGTWRRRHPPIRRRCPQPGTARPGSGEPEGGKLNQGFSRRQSMSSDSPKLHLARHGDIAWTDIRDVVQNHLFKGLANLAMEPPAGTDEDYGGRRGASWTRYSGTRPL